MFRRLAYRLMIVIPITLSVMLVTLYLFYQLPGSHILDSSRIQIGSDRELENLLRGQSSQEPYTKAKGLFYAGITRGYVPDSIHLIPAIFQTSFVDLSRDVRNPGIMNKYAFWINSTLNHRAGGNRSSISSHQLVQLLQAQSIKSLKKEIESTELSIVDRPEIWKQVLSSSPEADLPFLRIKWHGKQNLFHLYLKAIMTGSSSLRTVSNEKVTGKFLRSMYWTLAYTLPVLLIGWGLAYFLVLKFYNKPNILSKIDRINLLLYSLPTFVLATLALVFLTSHRYGLISSLFPFPVFLKSNTNGLWAIYRVYGRQLLLPMVLFAIPVIILFYRVFLEKIREVQHTQPSYQYLRDIGISEKKFRWRYLSRYLLVATWALISNLFTTLLGGSLIIEWVFNIPGLGRYFYEAVVSYDVASIVFLVFTFTVIQQLGHVVSDWILDTYFIPEQSSQGLL